MLGRPLGTYPATTTLGAENSEVLPPSSVAVAVTVCPTGIAVGDRKLNSGATPLASVATTSCPRKTFPSPPDGLEETRREVELGQRGAAGEEEAGEYEWHPIRKLFCYP